MAFTIPLGRFFFLGLLLLITISIAGCKERPQVETVYLTQAGFSKDVLGRLLDVQEKLYQSDLDLIPEKIYLKKIISSLQQKDIEKYKATIRSQYKNTYFVLANSFDVQVDILNSFESFNQDNLSQIKQIVNASHKNLQEIEALECHDTCVSVTESQWVFDTFFGGGAFAATVIGVIFTILGLLITILGFVVKNIIYNSLIKKLDDEVVANASFSTNVINASGRVSEGLLHYKQYNSLYKVLSRYSDKSSNEVVAENIEEIEYKQINFQLYTAIRLTELAVKHTIYAEKSQPKNLSNYKKQELVECQAWSYSNLSYFYAEFIQQYENGKSKYIPDELGGIESLKENAKSNREKALPLIDKLKTTDSKWHEMLESCIHADYYANFEKSGNIKEKITNDLISLFISANDKTDWIFDTAQRWDEKLGPGGYLFDKLNELNNPLLRTWHRRLSRLFSRKGNK